MSQTTKNNTDDEKKLLQKTKNLPDELIRIIHSYLSIKILTFMNKTYYFQYHSLLKPYIINRNIENYIRDVLRRDHEFVFEQILKENYKRWLEIKHFIYKNVIYKNYIYFIKDYCISNDSVKCRNLLNEFLEELGLCKNQHKKNIVKHIRWRN